MSAKGGTRRGLGKGLKILMGNIEEEAIQGGAAQSSENKKEEQHRKKMPPRAERFF